MSRRTPTAIALAAAVLIAPSGAIALDLATVLRQVAEANPTVAARRAMAEAATRRIAPAGAWPSPMLELGVANVPTSGRFDMDPMTMKMIGVTQRVPVFGANRLSASSARSAATAEAAAADQTLAERMGDAWEAYADAYYSEALVRLAESHQGEMDRLVQSARARYQAGRGRLDDVLRSEAERARTLADLASVRAQAQGARARLDALRGVEPGTSEAEALEPPPDPTVPADPGPWLAAVSPSHPRLREQQAQVERYRLSARAARRMLWPDLELRGSYAKRGTIDGVKQDDMFNASVAFMLPIFAGSRELSEAAEMEAMARSAEAERRATELDLREQIRAAYADAAAARRSVTLLADTVVSVQRRAVDASWAAYTAGSTDLWRVFESSHALYGEEIALLRTRMDLTRALARALAATARGDLVGAPVPAEGTRK